MKNAPERSRAERPGAAPGLVAAGLAAVARTRPLFWVLCYLLISGVICFFGLASIDVITMEGIVADGARHMVRVGEYTVPHLHGEIYSYKPPLAYWMALASCRLFGEETEWTLRFPFALSAMLMGLGVLLATVRVAGPRTGLLCAFASLTGVLTVQKLHLAEFDMPLAAGVGMAIAVACRILCAEQPRGGLWLIAYLALALGFLAKGVPALMFYAPGLLLAAVATRRHRELLKPGHLAGVLLFLVVVSAWLVGAFQAAGWQAFEQPIAEARDKGFTWSMAMVGSTLVKPFKVWALFLPWTLLLPASLRAGKWSSGPAWRMAVAAASFVAAGVMVFMTVPAAESRYLLPLAAPMGMLCGLAARYYPGASGTARRRAVEVLALVVGLGAVAIALGVSSADFSSRVVLAALATLILVRLGYGWFREPSRSRFQAAAATTARGDLAGVTASPGVPLLVAVAVLGWVIHTRGVEPHRAELRSLRAVAAAFEVHLEPESELWTGPVDRKFRHSSLFYYLRRPVRTCAADGGGPVAGDHIVFFSDEHGELMRNVQFDYRIIERRSQRRYGYMLARVIGHTPRLE